jgi:hypothetical protein
VIAPPAPSNRLLLCTSAGTSGLNGTPFHQLWSGQVSNPQSNPFNIAPDPIISITGNPAAQYEQIVINTFTGGALGSMVFYWSTDGYLTVNGPVSTTAGVADYPLGSTGLAVHFSNPATTIAAGSNGLGLPQATINVASTAGFPPSVDCAATTIAAGSNGSALQQTTTINVASTAGFSSKGSVVVESSNGPQTISYSGITSGSFTGCQGGAGTLSTGGAVTASAGLQLSSIVVQSSSGPQTISYARVTSDSFVGCWDGNGTLSAGDAVNISYPGRFYSSPPAGAGFSAVVGDVISDGSGSLQWTVIDGGCGIINENGGNIFIERTHTSLIKPRSLQYASARSIA